MAAITFSHRPDSDSAIGEESRFIPGQTSTSSTTRSSGLDSPSDSSVQNPISSGNSLIVAQPISPDDPYFANGPSPLSNPPISNPFAESNGQPKADPVPSPSSATPPTEAPIPTPPLPAPPTTVGDAFLESGITPDCSVRLIVFNENGRPRRIIQVVVRNSVSAIWVRATAGLKQQVQRLPVSNNYAETNLTISDLPIEISVFGSEFQEATSLGCTTFVNN